MSRLPSSSLRGLRSCLRPEYADMPAEDLETVIEPVLSGLPDATAEDFLRTLGSLGKAAGPALERAGPSIARGAATGASVGGPWGALIGAGAGLASPASSGTGRPRPTGPRTTAPSAPPSAAGTPGTPAAPVLPTGPEAAATLLSLFRNGLVERVLASQALSPSGLQEIPAPSGVSLPRGAINSLLTQLLANASEALPEAESISEQDYLRGESGEFLIDPASPEQQAAVVLSHLQRSQPQTIPADSGAFVDTEDWFIEELTGTESVEWMTSEESGEVVRFY